MSDLRMVIHPENTRVAVESPADAFRVWAQCDEEATGFNLVFDEKVAFSHRRMKDGTMSWYYVDGQLVKTKRVYFGVDSDLIVNSEC